MSFEQVCFTEVTLFPPEGDTFDWRFQTEQEYEECYGNIINVLIKVAVELYQEEPDVRHLPFIQVPLVGGE